MSNILSPVLQHRSPMTGAAFAADLLSVVRRQLGMEVGFISEFSGEERRFLFVDSDLADCPIQVGGADPLAGTYCAMVVEGGLPSVMIDAAANPIASRLPIAQELGIGGHISVPVRRRSGEVFGTLCCFSTRPEPSLGDLDLAMIGVVADMLGSALESDGDYYQWRGQLEAELRDYCSGGLEIVVQPIVDMYSGDIAGYEALSRFPGSTASPDTWFASATAIGWGPLVEAAAARAALPYLDLIPPEVYLSINSTPGALASREMAVVLNSAPPRRVVIEITEHTSFTGEPALMDSIGLLRAAGFRLAMDDAGSGYAGLRQILSLDPDLLKLDRDLTHGIDTDQARQSLAVALTSFAGRIGAKVIAEGIETEQQFDMIQSLGVSYGQGYLLGRPGPVDMALTSDTAAGGGW